MDNCAKLRKRRELFIQQIRRHCQRRGGCVSKRDWRGSGNTLNTKDREVCMSDNLTKVFFLFSLNRGLKSGCALFSDLFHLQDRPYLSLYIYAFYFFSPKNYTSAHSYIFVVLRQQS